MKAFMCSDLTEDSHLDQTDVLIWLKFQKFLPEYKIIILFTYAGHMVPLVHVIMFRVDQILISKELLAESFFTWGASGCLQHKLTVATGQVDIFVSCLSWYFSTSMVPFNSLYQLNNSLQ